MGPPAHGGLRVSAMDVQACRAAWIQSLGPAPPSLSQGTVQPLSSAPSRLPVARGPAEARASTPQRARLQRPDVRQPRSGALTAHPTPASRLPQANLDAQGGLDVLSVRIRPPPGSAVLRPRTRSQGGGQGRPVPRLREDGGTQQNGPTERAAIVAVGSSLVTRSGRASRAATARPRALGRSAPGPPPIARPCASLPACNHGRGPRRAGVP